MDLTSPTPFLEALQALNARHVLPTSLTSAELQQVDAAIRRGSFFSAQTMEQALLDQYKSDVESIINPTQEKRADRVTAENPEGNVTTGYDPATARLRAKQLLQKLGYKPEDGEAGTLKDLSSNARINLVVRTNVELSQGAGGFMKQNLDADVVDLWPALELVRFEARAKQRDWHQRWMEAASYSGDADAARMLTENGRMVARKDSPIWDALGSTELFDDALDNPFPPFAFNSGMWTMEVSRDEAVELGLIDDGDKVAPRNVDIANFFNFGKS